MLVAKGSSLQSKFVKNFKSKVFKRFLLEKGAAASRYEQESTSAQKLSLQDIIMESWTGSRVYKLTHEKSHKKNRDNSSANNLGLGSASDASIEPPEEVVIEI